MASPSAATTPSGSGLVGPDDNTQDDIPLRLRLGDVTLVMGATGQWELGTYRSTRTKSFDG